MSVGKVIGGGNKPPPLALRTELAGLVRQLRGSTMARGASRVDSPEWAFGVCRIERGALGPARRGGDWRVYASIQGWVGSDDPVKWTSATQNGTWSHAAAGWWPTEAEAWAALTAAVREAYAEEYASRAAETARIERASREIEARRPALQTRIDAVVDRLRALGAVDLWGDGFCWQDPETLARVAIPSPHDPDAVERCERDLARLEATRAEWGGA